MKVKLILISMLMMLLVSRDGWCGEFREYKPSDPEFNEARIAEPSWTFEMQDQNTAHVIIKEWAGYQGSDPNRSYRLEKLIQMAQEMYEKKKWKLVEILYTPEVDFYGNSLEPKQIEYYGPAQMYFPGNKRADISCIDYGYYPCIRKRTLVFRRIIKMKGFEGR